MRGGVTRRVLSRFTAQAMTSAVTATTTMVSASEEGQDLSRVDLGVSGTGSCFHWPPEQEQSEPSPQDDTDSCARSQLWLQALGLTQNQISSQEYGKWIQLGPSGVHEKLLLDLDRTFKRDLEFQKRVPRSPLIRVLNAFAWASAPKWKLEKEYHGGYVQGMNVLAGLLLYVMSELEAFYCLDILLNQRLPMYIRPNLEGVHTGSQLVHQVIQVVKPQLYQKLVRHQMMPEMYAFAPIMTLSACTPPLSEAILIWDFLMKHGISIWNVLTVAAQITLMERELLSTEHPMKLLRTLPDLKSNIIIEESHNIYASLMEHRPEILNLLERHGREEICEPFSASSLLSNILLDQQENMKFMTVPMKLNVDLTEFGEVDDADW